MLYGVTGLGGMFQPTPTYCALLVGAAPTHSVPRKQLYPPVARGTGVLGLRQDVLHRARIPLAMETLDSLVEPDGARRHQPQPMDDAVRHREHRRHEHQEVQGLFIMPRREEGFHIGGAEARMRGGRGPSLHTPARGAPRRRAWAMASQRSGGTVAGGFRWCVACS